MKLAYLVNQYPQPSHSFIRREICALEKLGHVVHRFTVRRSDTTLVDPADQLEYQSTRPLLDAGKPALLGASLRNLVTRPIRFVQGVRMAHRLSRHGERGFLIHLIYLAEASLLRQMLAELKVDHLHAHFGTNSASVALLCHTLGGPRWSLTVHGSEEFDKPQAIHLTDKIEQASLVIAISNFCRSQLYRWCSHDQWKKIHVVHCGLDDKFLNEPAVGVPDEPRLVYVGRLADGKGLQILVAAAAQLAAEEVDLHLTLIGDGPMRPQIEQMIAHHGLQNQIELAGWRSGAQIRQSLLESRALILPSLAEGLPVVIMESFALNRPVISTQVGGVPELVETGQTGWLIPPGDTEALAGAMRQAIQAPADELNRLGQAGAQRIIRHHNAQTEAVRLSELLSQSILNHP